MNYKDLKLKLTINDLKFNDLVKADGRSYQYLWRECKAGNQKVLNHLETLIKKLSKC
ncbi:hypothetical protein [uncultured Fusobacterium sp.]|uniref:hypothetical protein n=1 Tax=uncultured Fusobacterium sp. TaxID=159267 RepID=UPI0025D6129F|nr:hypothetical protein [uncultured Fusobacterium sp.]